MPHLQPSYPARWETKPGDTIEAFGQRATIEVVVRCGDFEDQDVIVITKADGSRDTVTRYFTRKT